MLGDAIATAGDFWVPPSAPNPKNEETTKRCVQPDIRVGDCFGGHVASFGGVCWQTDVRLGNMDVTTNLGSHIRCNVGMRRSARCVTHPESEPRNSTGISPRSVAFFVTAAVLFVTKLVHREVDKRSA